MKALFLIAVLLVVAKADDAIKQCTDTWSRTMEADPFDLNAFYVIADPALKDSRVYRMPCVEGTTFSLASCRCEGNVVPNTTTPSRLCTLYLPFDDDFRDRSMNQFYTEMIGNAVIDNTVSARGWGSLLLDGASRIEVPGTNGIDFGNQASICFYVRCPVNGSCNGGLISNRNGASASEITLILAMVNGNMRVASSISSPEGNPIPINATFNTEGYGFSQACFIIDGQNVSLYTNNILIASFPFIGEIAVPHSPLSIGSDSEFGNFTGYIDEVLVCKFGLTAAEVEAHWAGRASMEIAGLVPSKPGIRLPDYLDTPAQPSPGMCGHNALWNSGETFNSNTPSLGIIGGKPAQDHEFPWMTVLLTRDGSRRLSGTLISSNWLLTAAHGIQDGDTDLTFTAFFGQDAKRPKLFNSTYDDYWEFYPVKVETKRIIVHSMFNPDSLDYDFALIELATPVPTDTTWNIQSVCLPASCNDACQPGEKATIMGYGMTSEGDQIRHNTMMKATVAIVDQDLCTSLYQSTGIPVTSTLLCASNNWRYGGVDTCNGDGSNGLLCFKNGYFTIDGLTATGAGCAEPRFPGIYARVCTVLDWIREKTTASR